jgi:hypothetical protein
MAKRAGKGRLIGSSGFKREELDSLMVTILRLQPIGAEDWQMVVSAHFNETGIERSVDTVKKKFKVLREKKVCTQYIGDKLASDYNR